MNNSHIIDILDSAPLAKLDEAQLVSVRTHILTCASCARAYEAAAILSQVIHERVTVEVEPSPFFATTALAISNFSTVVIGAHNGSSCGSKFRSPRTGNRIHRNYRVSVFGRVCDSRR